MVAFFWKKRYDAFFWFIFIFSLCIFCNSLIHAEKINTLQQGIQQAQGKLKAIENKILEGEKRLRKIQTEEKKVFQRVEICDQFIEKYGYERRVFDDKICINQLKQDNLHNEINRLQTSLANQKNFLALRLRSWYKSGPLRFWRVIFGSDSFMELSQKIAYLRVVAEEDSQLIQNFAGKIKKKRIKQEKIHHYQQEVEELRKEIIEQETEWIKKKEEKELYLGILQNKGERFHLISQELHDQRAEIQKLLTKLQKNQVQQSLSFDFASKKGQLFWPIQGLSYSFAGNKSGEGGIKVLPRNKGIVIQAPEGQEIYSIYEGKVLYADWCIGYGKLLIVDHGEGYCSIYAHISELLINSQDIVKEGQLIALVGDTGAVREPQLYFEIRFNGKPFEPLAWLQ